MADTKAEAGSMASDQRALLESGEGADVVLVVGDSQLPAHSQFLAARSPVFAAMLRSGMEESRSRRIEINDVREAVMRQLLSFIYCDEAPLLESMAAELLVAADKYDLPLLKKRCERRLVLDLNVENAADTGGLAERHSCPELTKAVVQFVGRQPEVLATAGWRKLLRENTEAAEEISKQLAAVESRKRKLTEEQKQGLFEKLVAAASKGQTGEVRSLIEAGAPVDQKDSSGETALYKAAQNGREDTVRCLIDAGVDVNASTYCRWTPLHSAAYNDHERIVWMLVAASANLDAQRNDGWTPLHLAANYGRVSATRALLLAGARRDLRDNSGKTPASVADSRTKELFNS